MTDHVKRSVFFPLEAQDALRYFFLKSAVNLYLNPNSVDQIQEIACKIEAVHNVCISQASVVHTLSVKHFQERQCSFTISP